MCYLNKQHKVLLPTEVIAAAKLIRSDKKMIFGQKFAWATLSDFRQIWVGQGPSAETRVPKKTDRNNEQL